MRFYTWASALWVIVGLPRQAGMTLRSWPSCLAIVGVILFSVRETVGFWGRWFNPDDTFGAIGPIIYPIKWIGGAAVFLALLLGLIVFVQGAQRAATM
jgi:hypothetical protein